MATDRSIYSTLVSLLLLLVPAAGLAAPGHHHPDALAPAIRATPGLPQEVADPVVEHQPEDRGEGKAAAKGEKDEAWDVSVPHGPSHTVTVDTTSGTWLNLDVSPDGREIAFDMLGDIYTVPIGGGEATALTEGMEWDMQPTYSPDGSTIAFTSDQGGGDNLWLMDRDGSNPRAVTDESFRLLNSPAWAPDGQFLAGRKHYTGTRSLGAGEIWIYHRSGGGGLQMTERPNDQKDVGEPAFSPDDRYVYYSRDATPGAYFEYNKDPNAGIYSIFRLDRRTGETDELISGPGGAVRPTPSPDGELLAFVRRVRDKTVLWMRDLTSGEERPLYDGLDRDMQETWAIHGVYPRMAWTPDSASVVFWAGGGIHRVSLGTRVVTDIPFHVRVTKTLVHGLRFPVDVAPERFTVKMIRWPTVSPDGSRVVFQALGRIWIKELPDGTPRRLIAGDGQDGQDGPFELYPAFSPDGTSVVYTTWDDAALGTVRTVDVASGAVRTVVGAPGHYVEPVFTPDGGGVVYRKVAGGYLRSDLWSDKTGLYFAPLGASSAAGPAPGAAAASEPRLITEDGSDPHFGAQPDLLYFERQGEGGRVLVSIGLDGKDEHELLKSENAGRFRVSPDGRWVAWQERFNAHIAPLVPTGKTVTLSQSTQSIPVATVSRDAGDFLSWGAGSDRLYWSLGPELFHRDLTDAFAFLHQQQDAAPADDQVAEQVAGPADDPMDEQTDDEADATAALPEPPAEGEGVAMGLEAETVRPTGTLAFVGGRIVTMRGDEVIEDGTLVVDGDRIRAVGPRAQVQVPEGARVIDTSGKTLIPGLVDVHWHGGHGSDGIIPQQNWDYFATLAFGVTTIHDPSADTATVFSSAEMARAGLITAPRVYSTGTILYGAETPFQAVIDDLDDARSHLRRMKAVGAISVKSYNQPRRDQRQQVLQAAREQGMMVVPEGGSLFEHNMTMVVDGHTGIEHSIPVAAIYDDVRQLWGGANDVGYTPTLIVGYGGLWGENYWYAKTNVWEDQRLLSFVPRGLIDARSRRRITAPDDEWNHFNNARVANELHQAGVNVQLGAHGQREGLGAHWELWMLGQGGMSNHEALRTATLAGAWYLGMDADIGSLEPGKLADVAILDENPLEDLRNSKSVDLVVVGGRVYDAATMNEIAPVSRERRPFFWERGADGRLLILDQ